MLDLNERFFDDDGNQGGDDSSGDAGAGMDETLEPIEVETPEA
jgi:hypothetical protein